MKSATSAEALSQVPLFSAVPRRTLERLAKDAGELDVAPRTVLFNPGDACTGMYIITSGRVKLSLPRIGAIEKVVALLSAGNWFGETALFTEQPHIVAAQTLARSRLLFLPTESVLRSIRRDACLAAVMISELSRRLRENMVEIDRASGASGTERFVDFLLSELPADAEGAVTVTLPAKKRLVASRLDLTHEHFSRMLRELRREGLIDIDGRRLHVHDVGALRARRRAPASPAPARDSSTTPKDTSRTM